MKENKKSGGGDVRAKALSWDGEWDKSRKLIFSFISTLAHGGLLRTPLTSLAARKKSRFAEKKSASPKKNCAYSLQDRIVFVDKWWIAILGVFLNHYMAVACPYLRSVIVWGCVLNERAVKILGKFFGEKLHK